MHGPLNVKLKTILTDPRTNNTHPAVLKLREMQDVYVNIKGKSNKIFRSIAE